MSEGDTFTMYEMMEKMLCIRNVLLFFRHVFVGHTAVGPVASSEERIVLFSIQTLRTCE